jgi:hypothetical protein
MAGTVVAQPLMWGARHRTVQRRATHGAEQISLGVAVAASHAAASLFLPRSAQRRGASCAAPNAVVQAAPGSTQWRKLHLALHSGASCAWLYAVAQAAPGSTQWRRLYAVAQAVPGSTQWRKLRLALRSGASCARLYAVAQAAPGGISALVGPYAARSRTGSSQQP